jgi:hypothetical protein
MGGPLTVATIIRHGRQWHARREVVTETESGPRRRARFAAIAARAARLANGGRGACWRPSRLSCGGRGDQPSRMKSTPSRLAGSSLISIGRRLEVLTEFQFCSETTNDVGLLLASRCTLST